MLVNVALYFLSFFVIWLGAGLIVKSISKFSRRFKLSQFVLSFFVLGILTSTPEMAVGLTAISQNDPEIFIGNLLGGIPVIFLFIVPILAILGNGINLKHELDDKILFVGAIVILAPFLLILDKKVTVGEGILFILLYLVLLVVVQRKHGLFDKVRSSLIEFKPYSYFDAAKLLLGIGVIFLASSFIVEKTIYFSEVLTISPFYISLIALSLGTNLPELSLAVRSVTSGKKDIAFGDYIGSAAANTLLFGIFTLLSHGEVVTINNFTVVYYFIAAGLFLFYVFSQSKNTISRREGFILLFIYILFVAYQISGKFLE